MTQSSFTERLQRIEKAQGKSAHDRLLVGVADEIVQEATPKKAKKPAKAARPAKGAGGLLPLRFVVGFALMFATFWVMGEMRDIHGWLNGFDVLTPYTNPLMGAVALGIAAVMLFFAFKMQRAAFRVLSEPARLPFVIGMVAGLALGAGPTEFTDEMVAQLQVAQQ
ncbi:MULTISPECIES: hypothetical protein [unclassified Roseovarius]|uniref:hypothetical protein n=1 Tax=unclassified Roseovarius TaxID=2614913 RepID=UPI00273F1DC1|nr:MULTISPECIES: hypothetical protein [unclassified Roseovarius]